MELSSELPSGHCKWCIHLYSSRNILDSKPNGETVHLLTIWIWQMINWSYTPGEFGELDFKKKKKGLNSQSSQLDSLSFSTYNPSQHHSPGRPNGQGRPVYNFESLHKVLQ